MKSTSLTHGAMYITVSTIIFVLSGYLINIILGRQLGPASYGIYGIIITLMTTINLTQISGLPQAVAKFTAEDEAQSESILRSGLLLQLISTGAVTILILFLATPIAHLLGDTTLIPYIQLSAFVFPFYGIYSLYLCYYNGLHYFKTQAFMGIAYALLKFISIILLVYLFHVYGAILGFIISPVVALLFWFHFPTKVLRPYSYKKLILFSLPLIGLAIFGTLLQSVDLFFVKGLLHDNKFAGLYTANQNIAEIPFYAVPSFTSVLFPGISRSIKQNLKEHTYKIISNSLRFSLLIILPSVLLLSATSTEILQFLYSSSFISGSNSLAILVIGDGFFTLFTLLSTILSGAGSPVRVSFIAGIGVIISACLCFFLIPVFGLIGAALSTTIAAFIVMAGAVVLVYKKFHVLFPLKNTLKIVVASLAVYFLARVIVVPTMLLPMLYIVLFGIYGILLFLLKEITRDDIKKVKELLPSWLINK